jgi:hypothetical protein
MDAARRLYGTTLNGGAHNAGGTEFVLTFSAAKTKWTETVLYSFGAQFSQANGVFPLAGLIMDGIGHLFGTTVGDGAPGGNGPLLELLVIEPLPVSEASDRDKRCPHRRRPVPMVTWVPAFERVKKYQDVVIPGRGRSPRARNPST